MLVLTPTKRTDEQLLDRMSVHYSQPKGFVGRNICYAIFYDNSYYGHIVGGSATKYLPGRNEFFNNIPLNNIVNNIFFNVQRREGKYPVRNFIPLIIQSWRTVIQKDWYDKYGDTVLGFESLIELPRTGESYLRDGWQIVGTTKGYTCKRVSGKGTDSWSGKRLWDTKNLRPKLVLVRRIDER